MAPHAPPEYPVKVGSMLYTLVDPHKGHEVAYNRWYERDHYYGGCLSGPWCLAGSRWVATRELKDLRFPVEGNAISDPVDRGSYVAIYWVEDGHHDEHFSWGAKQVVDLYMAGRGFGERTHAHTVLYLHFEAGASGINTRGPEPSQSTCVAKIPLDPERNVNHVTISRAHRWIECSPGTLTSIKFFVRDSRGSVVDLKAEGASMSFVVTSAPRD